MKKAGKMAFTILALAVGVGVLLFALQGWLQE